MILRSTRSDIGRETGHALHELTDSTQRRLYGIRDRVAPVAGRFASRTEDLATRGYDAARDSTLALRERALDAAYYGRRYLRNEPVKSVLIAAAAAGAIVALAQWLSHRRR